MRVAHIITRMIIGGAQENTLYNCLDLVNNFGDEVLLITGPALGPEGQLLEQGRAGGLKVAMINSLRRAIHPLNDWRAYRETVKRLESSIREWFIRIARRVVFWDARRLGNCKVPAIVHTVHGAPFHPYQRAIARNAFIALERWAAKRCHHMISVADAMTDLMVAANVASREKFTTIYSGMDVEPFRNCNQFREAARNELGIAPDEIVFGKIARLFHLKGHEYLIAAAEQAVHGNPKCRFLLIGDGILRAQLERDIAARGLTGRFIFTGLVPPERIPFYLSAMDALVHTSLREGLARTLPQALIAGKPVISYDIDGAREVVLPGETGFLLPAKTIGPLAEAILALASDSALRDRLGQGGAARFTDRFRHQQMTSEIRRIYQRLLGL